MYTIGPDAGLERLILALGGQPLPGAGSAPVVAAQIVNQMLDVGNVVQFRRTRQKFVELAVSPLAGAWASLAHTVTVPTIIQGVELVGRDTLVAGNFDRAALYIELPGFPFDVAKFLAFANLAFQATGTGGGGTLQYILTCNGLGTPEFQKALPMFIPGQNQQDSGAAVNIVLEAKAQGGGASGEVAAVLDIIEFPDADMPPYTPR